MDSLTPRGVQTEPYLAALPLATARTGRAALRHSLIQGGFYVAAVALALLIISGLLELMHASPLAAFSTVIRSSLGSQLSVALTLNEFTPILLGSAGIAFAMRAGLVNLGVDGQIYAGAICAVAVAFTLPSVPSGVALAAVLLAGVAGGAVFGSIAAVLRKQWHVNELFTTVMMNFVGFYLADWITTGVWTDPTAGQAVTKAIPDRTVLPSFLGQSQIGVLIALPVAVALDLVLTRTRLGYELRANGLNPRAAALGGVRTARAAMVTLTASGLVAGLAGAIEVTGVQHRLPSGLSPGYGYISVLIAVISRCRPVVTIPVAFLMAMLLVGGDALEASIGLPSEAVLMLQALIVIAILLVDLLTGRWRGSHLARRWARDG